MTSTSLRQRAPYKVSNKFVIETLVKLSRASTPQQTWESATGVSFMTAPLTLSVSQQMIVASLLAAKGQGSIVFPKSVEVALNAAIVGREAVAVITNSSRKRTTLTGKTMRVTCTI